MLTRRPRRVTHIVHNYARVMFLRNAGYSYIYEYFHDDAYISFHSSCLLSFSSCSSCGTGKDASYHD